MTSTSSCSTPPSRWDCSAPASACPTGSSSTEPRSRSRARAGARAALAHVLRGAAVVMSAGGYPAAEAARAAGEIAAPVVEVPPGVDTAAIVTLRATQRRAARARLGLPATGPLVVSLSRLVPRKGMDVLITAAGRLAPSYPDLVVAIGGDGRELDRLQRQAAASPVPVMLLGRVSDEDRAALLGAADIFVMACRNRWLGLEQEGFGIVFSRPRPPGYPRSPGTAGERPRRWSTG